MITTTGEKSENINQSISLDRASWKRKKGRRYKEKGNVYHVRTPLLRTSFYLPKVKNVVQYVSAPIPMDTAFCADNFFSEPPPYTIAAIDAETVYLSEIHK